ncbi:hypothetical protein NHQ30_000358 [Ciborinia camelliae]|nr:hypothetical protein NHQ30_000358 [Ciborinia camelliae]
MNFLANTFVLSSKKFISNNTYLGTIIEIGAGVTGFQIGQKVTIQPTIADHTCAACWGGGLSDAISIPSELVIPLPDNIPLDVGALVEPLSVGWHAVRQSPLTPSSTILIVGGGPIGLAIISALKARGCGQIMLSEPTASRQKFAKQFGADFILDPASEGEEGVARRVTELTGGKGVDIAFDCAGVAAGLKTACSSIKARGTVVNVAIWENPVPFNPNDLVWREGKYIASLGYVRRDFEETIAAIASGSINPATLITSKISLENVVEDGFRALVLRRDMHVKILVRV